MSGRRIYEGRVVNLRVEEVAARSGGTREVEVVEHAGGVVVIAQPAPGEIVLVRQYRFAVGETLWEAPAGMLERGEDPAQAARRELREETGYRCGRLRPLFTAYSTPGFCEERLHFFAATELEPGDQDLDEIEEIEVRTWRVADALALVENDQLRDAKTQIALLWAARQGRA
jgi:ADP-ribose pyrophosphatase